MIQDFICGPDVTIVVARPEDESSRRIIKKALSLLDPYITTISRENSVELVEHIESQDLELINKVRHRIANSRTAAE